jgi:hypothetical protein
MPSAESSRAASREHRRQADANLTESRRGKSTIRDRADTQVPPSHGQRSRRLPGVKSDQPL